LEAAAQARLDAWIGEIVGERLKPLAELKAAEDITGLARREWKMEDLLGEEKYWRNGSEMAARGLYLALPPRGAQIFHFTPAK